MTGHLGERLSAFLDGEMSSADRAAAQGHLRDCAVCARALEELASVDAMVRELPVEAPAGYFDALPGRVRARVRARRKPFATRAAVWAVAAAAVVMFAMVTPQLLLRRDASPFPAAAPAKQAASARQAEAEAPRSLPGPTPAPVGFVGPSSAPKAFDEQGAPAARLEERDRLAKAIAPARPPAPATPRAADVAPRDQDLADSAVLAPPAALPPATAVPGAAAPPAPAAAGTAQTRAMSAVAPAEDKAEEAALPEAAGARPQAKAGKDKADATPRGDANRDAPAGFDRGVNRRIRVDERYEMLRIRRPTTVSDARALSKAWEAFAREMPADRRADEARVRAIDAAVTAWHLGGDPADLASARAAAQAYLDLESAVQRDHVRGVLESLPPSP